MKRFLKSLSKNNKIILSEKILFCLFFSLTIIFNLSAISSKSYLNVNDFVNDEGKIVELGSLMTLFVNIFTFGAPLSDANYYHVNHFFELIFFSIFLVITLYELFRRKQNVMFIRTIVFVSYLIYIISLLIRTNQGFIISMIFTIVGTIVALLLVFLNISEIINEENIVDYLKNKTKRLFASFLLVAFFYIFSFARIHPYTIWRADYEGFQLTVKNIVLLNLSSRHVSSFMVFSILDTIFLFVTIISKHIIFKNYNLVNND